MKKKYKIITSLIMFILIIIIIFYEIFKYPKEVAIFDSNTIVYYGRRLYKYCPRKRL